MRFSSWSSAACSRRRGEPKASRARLRRTSWRAIAVPAMTAECTGKGDALGRRGPRANLALIPLLRLRNQLQGRGACMNAEIGLAVPGGEGCCG